MWVVWTFAVWTVFVWGTRIRNILADDGGTAALVAAVALTVLGLGVAISAGSRGRSRHQVVAIAAIATFVTWAVRVPQILLHDHGAGFVVVHLLLAAVSTALAVAAWRRTSQPAPVGL
jgi:hypothetical protein